MDMLILYNPYYQSDVIEAHLEVLKNEGKVAFGKIKSKMRNDDMQYPAPILEGKYSLESLAESISKDNPLQLFLSDYANLFVCKVIALSQSKNVPAPAYYAEKGLEVEWWFHIIDMRELVRNDFLQVRDGFLASCTTPHNGNRTFALYGNNYTYPLPIKLKTPKAYFDTELHYHDVFKTSEQIILREHFINYIFGSKLIYAMEADTMDNLINAEIEYQANRINPLYDYTGIVMRYAKSMEQEIHCFMKMLIMNLRTSHNAINEIEYGVQNKASSIGEWCDNKAKVSPNLGTFKFIMSRSEVREAFIAWRDEKRHSDGFSRSDIWNLSSFKLKTFIESLQSIRNPAAHANVPTMAKASMLREMILGIGCESILVMILCAKNALKAK